MFCMKSLDMFDYWSRYCVKKPARVEFSKALESENTFSNQKKDSVVIANFHTS